ncbi:MULTISPECIES: glycosyltransferase family 2 protein [unclassified Bradyrhizobium]|uniref:glycosyltransferase family 2 protein n=1 Tax=unclassified Bradyrhizobium TaxID=2631580 RepID=UPI00339A6AE9
MLVSVVIPLFNRQDRIEGAIRSALSQQPKPLEIIVVDDGSSDLPDETWLPGIDPCVRVIRHEKNRGGAVARNTGIDAAKGDVIAFLDADDRWLPGKLQTQLAQTAGSSNVFASGNIRIEGGPWDGRLYNPRPVIRLAILTP